MSAFQSIELASKQLVTMQHAAQMLDLRDTRVVMRLVREGKIRARKIGRRNYVVVSSLRDFCESGR